jgi:hypothetical protein
MTRRVDITMMGLLLAIGAAYQLGFLHAGVGLIDEGHLANGALRIARGEILYRDIFTVYPPGSFYLVAGLFELFEPSLILVRTFHLVMTLALALAVYLTSRSFVSPVWALMSGLLIAATGWEAIVERLHYAYLYSVFPISALALLSVVLRKPVRRWGLVGVGALAGITLAFRLVPFVGLAIAATFMVVLDRRNLRAISADLGWLIAGGLSVVAPIGFCFAIAGAGADLFASVFWTSFEQYLGGGELNLPFPPLQLLPTQWSAAGIRQLFINWEFYLPLLIYLGAAIDFALNARASARSQPPTPMASAPRLRCALAIFGGILFLRATGRSDYYHLAPVLAPAYILGVDFLSRPFGRLDTQVSLRLATGKAPSLGKWANSATVICLFLLSLWLHDVPRALARSLDTARTVELSPGGPRIAKNSVIDDLVADLKQRTGKQDPIVVLPWYPIVYFLADRPNPTRYDWLFPGYLREEHERSTFIETIEHSRADVLVYAPAAIDGRRDRRLAGFEPEIDRYVRERFRVEARHGPFIVMSRRRP